jgi:glutathione S-transferase
MKLWFTPGSPFARKVRIVLAEKQIPFEPVVLSGIPSPEFYRDITPTLAIPVLEDKEHRLFDSSRIIEYLLATYPGHTDLEPPMAPSMTRPERHWDDGQTLAAIETFGNATVNMRLMSPTGATPANNAYLGRQLARAERLLDWLEDRATEDGFAPGWFSVMDIGFICQVAFCEKRAIMPWRGRPRLEALFDRFAARPSVASTPPDDLPPAR